MEYKHKDTVLENIKRQKTTYTYTFNNHFHPFVGKLIEKSKKGTIKDVLSADLSISEKGFFKNSYDIKSDERDDLNINYFPKKLGFTPDGAYAVYNWEIFYHIPLSIAVQLSKNQRFSDAQKWFHFIFDPTTDEKSEKVARYWKFKPFRENEDLDSIAELLKTLNAPAGEKEALKERLIDSIQAWRKNPFRPHTVARFRPLAYKYNVIMKYLDNLIDWGDSLFRQFTIESINEATQIYVLAASILGERPEEIPNLYKKPVRTYKQIKSSLDRFSNAMVEVENEFPLNSNLANSPSTDSSSQSQSLLGIGRQLYFCIPENDKLLKYWDIIDDRLFKIRNCMNIKGKVQTLPLFQPPISPGMLVKAAAAGVDLGSTVSAMNQPASNVRFRVIYQKALDLCNQLRSMGKDYLNALEKGDREKLSLLRQEHEVTMNELTSDVKYLRWKEAEESTRALLVQRQSAYENFRNYQRLLGKEESEYSDLKDITLTREEITEENFDEVYNSMVDQYAVDIDLEEYREVKLGLLGEAASNIEGIDAISAAVGVGGSNHLALNKIEDIELNVFMPAVPVLNATAAAISALAGPLSAVPQAKILASPLGVGGEVEFGGKQLAAVAKFTGQVASIGAKIASFAAGRAGKLSQYQRRVNEWVAQNNQASNQLQNIGRQIIASLITEQSLKKDYENHQEQIEQSKAVQNFIKNEKFTNEELYLWMQGELAKTYYDSYKLTFDTAKKAEVTLKNELMRKELDEQNFIKFNYWDAGRKGLLSAESLLLDLKKMDLAYMESNKREFEIVKHVSLKRLHPKALLELRATGSCNFNIPEWVYDLDTPGHYMRRIKSVRVSVPCVTGPYTGVNCTLSLQKSSIRTSALIQNKKYERANEDDRFKDKFGAIESIVTSNAQNDSGLFEVNFNGEQYLPFEGAGAISSWKLELPSELRQFDYNTISDIIIHVKYTARQGGKPLADAAVTWLNENLAPDGNLGTAQLFSLKHDFPNEWHRFSTSQEDYLSITVTKDHLPYLVNAKKITVNTGNTELYEISEKQVKTIGDAFQNLSSAFEVDGDTSRKEITIKGEKIRGMNNVFLFLAYSAE